jgi:hypothetical protein
MSASTMPEISIKRANRWAVARETQAQNTAVTTLRACVYVGGVCGCVEKRIDWVVLRLLKTSGGVSAFITCQSNPIEIHLLSIHSLTMWRCRAWDGFWERS